MPQIFISHPRRIIHHACLVHYALNLLIIPRRILPDAITQRMQSPHLSRSLTLLPLPINKLTATLVTNTVI